MSELIIENKRKRRNRVPKSCCVCRLRKLKCDRIKPICGSCVINDTKDLCKYEEPTWAQNLNLKSNWDNELTTTSSSSSFLESYNSTRIAENVEKGKDNPYSIAAKIPIAFIPSDSPNPSDGLKKLGNLNANGQINPKKRKLLSFDVSSDDYPLTLNDGKELENLKNQINILEKIISKIQFNITKTNDYTVNNIEIEDKINFYTGYDQFTIRRSRDMFRGPLSLLPILMKDSFLSICLFVLTDKTYKKNEKEKEKEKEKQTAIPDIINQEKKELVPLNLSIPDIQKRLASKIVEVLPSKKVIWLLYERYINYTYQFLPYIDKAGFENSIKNIMGDQSLNEAKVEHLNISKRSDFATLGILLVILRLGYLSIWKNKKTDNPDEHVKYLLSQDLSPNLIAVAQLCLNQFRILSKNSLLTFQLAAYLRMYSQDAPEFDGSCNIYDLQNFTGLLIQIAISIGLHVDPINFNETEKNLRRKLWAYLRFCDIIEASRIGCPLRIKDGDYNTRLPEFIKEIPGKFDNVIENRAIKIIYETDEILSHFKDVINLALNFNGCKVSLLSEKINVLEKKVNQDYMFLKKIIDSPTVLDEMKRLINIRTYLSTKYFLTVVYYNLFLHYEKQKKIDLAKMYYFKLLELSVDAIVNYDFIYGSNLVISVGNEHVCFELQGYYMLTSHIQVALFVRCRYLQALKTLDDPIYTLLEVIIQKLSTNLLKQLYTLSKLASDYYLTWRAAKGSYQVLKRLLSSDKLFAKDVNGEIYVTPRFRKEIKLPEDGDIFAEFKLEDFVNINHMISPENFQYMKIIEKIDDFEEPNKIDLHTDKTILSMVKDTKSWINRKSQIDFYANFSNHNINYDNLFADNYLDNLLNDLMDF